MIYFLSDIHLGAAYIADHRAHESRVVAFLQSIEADSETVYLLGDILDYWFEYRTVVPRGYVRFFGQLARMADKGIKIVWFTGNHDVWMFDYLRDELGIEVIDAPDGGVFTDIKGSLFYLGHGDMIGRQPFGYRVIHAIFHNRVCQRLYASLHPRWTLPFAHGWSSHSRKAAPEPEFGARARAAVEVRARQLVKENPEVAYIVMGHYHVCLDEPVTPTCRLMILGNWINSSDYAAFDGKTLTLKHYEDTAPR